MCVLVRVTTCVKRSHSKVGVMHRCVDLSSVFFSVFQYVSFVDWNQNLDGLLTKRGFSKSALHLSLLIANNGHLVEIMTSLSVPLTERTWGRCYTCGSCGLPNSIFA